VRERVVADDGEDWEGSVEAAELCEILRAPRLGTHHVASVLWQARCC
jgi:hypothetical protein